jgi:uncharacterized protein YkwD
LLVLFFAGALFTTLLPATTATAVSRVCWKSTDAERGFARRMNTERDTRDMGTMRLDPELSKAARVHTREMIRRNELYHTTDGDLRYRVTNWIELGENVGVGGTVSSLHDAFMNSPAHRDNVLHNLYRHVGVGVKKANDRMWVTIIFEAVTDPGTPLRMPRC